MDSSDPVVEVIARELRELDPSACLIPDRILRRVIRQDQGMTGLTLRVPHRKTYSIARTRLLTILDAGDLGLSSEKELPDRVILIALPDRDDWQHLRPETLRRQVWRLLFHSRIHEEFEKLRRERKLSRPHFRERIHELGEVQFDEVRMVLTQEALLLPDSGSDDQFIEFAAVYFELKHFAPRALEGYFPALAPFHEVEQILSEYVDDGSLLQATKLPGSAEGTDLAGWEFQQFSSPPSEPDPVLDKLAGNLSGEMETLKEQITPAERTFHKLVSRADQASQRGNSVRSSILYLRAAHIAPPEKVTQITKRAQAELHRLTERLQLALGFSDAERSRWKQALVALLRNTLNGFWTPERRLLSDLQGVCIDSERMVYIVDTWDWIRSFGRRPIKRALPNQREVLIAKHLRTAAGRLAAIRVTFDEREELTSLIGAAARAAETQLRDKLRPTISRLLDDVPLLARNVPERVSRAKIVEELSDKAVERGYLNIGVLRDTISRNQLKLGNLDTLDELIFGDQLLRADKKLSLLLDGVYRRGEFYLRWLQRVSSMAFATPIGRMLTKHIALPFGGAFIILEGLQHLFHAIEEHLFHVEEEKIHHASSSSLTTGVLFAGIFIWSLIHLPQFRRLCIQVWLAFVHVIRGFLLDLPRWIMRITFLREFLHSPVVIFFRRYLASPLLLTIFFRYLLPPLFRLIIETFAWFNEPDLPPLTLPTWQNSLFWFAGFFLILNSRMGRNVEEVALETTQRAWHRIRVGIFIAFFDLIMESFKKVIEWIERFLYAVDEWLRFRSGETERMLAVKAVLAPFWGIVTFAVRFCVTLLIEPQINPIKHFPVVTVSHKIILPLLFPFASILKPTLGAWADAVATTVVFLTPGIFGFLVWELKENWKLYGGNRSPHLDPVLIGHHGENMRRLLRPGFHSGTIPKLYSRLRRAERHPVAVERRRRRILYRSRLHHVEESLHHFIEREFCQLLRESHAFLGTEIAVDKLHLNVNSIIVELVAPALSDDALVMGFESQAEWIVATIRKPGWILQLDPPQRVVLETALLGLYKQSGVDLDREQILTLLPQPAPPYDIDELGLTLWPNQDFRESLHYEIDDRKEFSPRPVPLAKTHKYPSIEADKLLVSHMPVLWETWVNWWQAEKEGRPLPPLLRELPHILPVSVPNPDPHP